MGQPVGLTLTVTNRTGHPCSLAATSTGTVTLAVTHAGRPVLPAFDTVDCFRTVPHMLSLESRVVAPGDSVVVPLANEAGGAVLRSVTPVVDGEAIGSLYAVGAPGQYTVSATYAMPGGQQGSCVGASGTATAVFRVGDCDHASAPLPWILPGALGGAGAAGLLIWALAAFPVRRALGRAVLTGTLVAG